MNINEKIDNLQLIFFSSEYQALVKDKAILTTKMIFLKITFGYNFNVSKFQR